MFVLGLGSGRVLQSQSRYAGEKQAHCFLFRKMDIYIIYIYTYTYYIYIYTYIYYIYRYAHIYTHIYTQIIIYTNTQTYVYICIFVVERTGVDDELRLYPC